jgi:hypothetical protein
MPWQFYTETLPETPADWAGLTVTARIVFDSFGTVNNWVVDDYATVNGYEFVRLNTKDLIYDVSEYWKSTGNNRFAAVSDATGGVFCAGFKLILSVEVPVEIRPDAGVEGRLGGMVLSTLGDNGEDHFVGPALLSGQTPNDQYITFVAQGIDAAVFQRLLQWEGGEDVPGEPLKRRVDRDAAVKTVLRLTSKTDNIEVTKVNVWVVEAFGVLVTNPAPGPRPLSQSNTVLAIDGSTGGVVFYALPSYRFKFAIEPIAIFDVSADVPELRGGKDTRGDSQLGDISPFSLEPLSGGATLRWDVSRRVQYRFRNPNLIPYNKLTANYGVLYDGQPIPDRVSVPFPSSAVIGNDDPKVLGEENNPYDPYRSAQNEFIEHDIGELASFDTPSLALPNSGGQEGFTFEEEDLFQEFARLQIGSNWYVISDPLPWKMIMKIKFQQGQWNDNGSTTGLGN